MRDMRILQDEIMRLLKEMLTLNILFISVFLVFNIFGNGQFLLANDNKDIIFMLVFIDTVFVLFFIYMYLTMWRTYIQQRVDQFYLNKKYPFYKERFNKVN